MSQTVADTGGLTLSALCEVVAARLGIDAASIDPAERLHRYGLTSISAASVVASLSERLGRSLSPTLIWDHPTLNQLVEFFQGADLSDDAAAPIAALPADEPIAIVGMSCRLPGATSLTAFWQMLCAETDAITEVPPERWPIDALYDPDASAPGKMATRWGGFIQDVDKFDAGFFGMSPREAAQADPQQRLALELAWEALENAAIRPSTLVGSRTGVFIGAMWSDYARLLGDPREIAQHTATGQDISIISARIAYAMGLEGPALTIDTACSSALVAVHQACRSLRAGESTVAIAGGVHLLLSPESSIAMTKFGAMAPDGRCKPFDARANGYVRGEGGGLVVLKPLHVAQKDHDRVYAVIRGGAMNNDGPSNGLTAPNPSAQRRMLRDALSEARVEADAVDYVEAHGTGTALGDPIEAQALASVLCRKRLVSRPLRIGSVKSNIGHLEAAAGAAGLIKLALSLQNRWIPASLHYKAPNSAIDFIGDRLDVQQVSGSWPGEADQPIGGVSSFGFGGTNCHLLLQAMPRITSGNPVVFVFAGNGGNWAGMAQALSDEPVFEAELAACDAVLAELGYPSPVAEVLDGAQVIDVALGQPALCAFQLAYASFLESVGIVPGAVIGHSVGEVAAACVAGALSRQQALQIVVSRSRLQASVGGQGRMALAVASEQDLQMALPADVVIAGENGPRATLLAGTPQAIDRACDRLDRVGILCQPIDVPVAYHSPQMDLLRPLLERELEGLAPQPGKVPIVSTVTGSEIIGSELDASYWGRNLRDRVRFKQGVEALRDAGRQTFLELAPHPLLAAQIRQMVPHAVVISPHRRGQATSFRSSLASLEAAAADARHSRLLILSAKSAKALDALRLKWANRLPDDWADLCHTALVGRDRFSYRLALCAATGEEAQRKLLANEVVRGEVAPGTIRAFDHQRAQDESWERYLDRCASAFVAGADLDFALFETGERRRVVDAPTYPFERQRHWLPGSDAGLSYELDWVPFAIPPGISSTDWPAVALTADPIDPGLDVEATRFALQAVDVLPDEQVAPRHRPLVKRLRRWSPMYGPSATDGPVAQLVRRVGRALPDLLRGEAQPLELLFPGGTLEFAASVYASPPFASAQANLAKTLAALGRPLRVLEVGAGTGALTAQLLDALPAGSTLVCSDVSDAFLSALRRRFSGYTCLETKRFDLDSPNQIDESFDAIVAANVVHAGASISDILHGLRNRLRPGGILGLVELVRAPRWIDLVFGLTEGWWRFDGDPLRPEHALLNEAAWTDALQQAGFVDIAVRPDGDSHAVILARSQSIAALPQIIGDGYIAQAMSALRRATTSTTGATATLWCPDEPSPEGAVAALLKVAADRRPLTVLHDNRVAHAAVTGATRAIMLDQPGSISACIELDDANELSLQAVHDSLMQENRAEDWFRVKNGIVSVPRVKRISSSAPLPKFSNEKLYVIAGGFGQLGQACARFLIARGVRHLLLVGRKGGDAIKLGDTTGSVRSMALDLTLPDASGLLRMAFDRPLGGIVHAAGIVDGDPEVVLATKLGVAATLAKAAEDRDLPFLLLFSSAAGVWGTRDHIAYAAANRALDRWTELAYQSGVRATSVAFGRFEQPGLLSSQEDASLKASGLGAMATEDALTAAFRAVADGVPHRIVASVDWPLFRATFEARHPRALFRNFAASSASLSRSLVSNDASANVPKNSEQQNSLARRSAILDRSTILSLVAELLGHGDLSQIDPQRGLFEQGLDSLMAVALRRRLEDASGVSVGAAILFSHPTVASLAGWFEGNARSVPSVAVETTKAATMSIAIVGMGCRFAGGGDTADLYFERLLTGRSMVCDVPTDRPTFQLWDAAPASTRHAGFLDAIELFDAAFFGISPREAAQLDPQQRLLLEVTWQALEHAGIAPDRLNGSRTGVFIGATGSDYAALARARGSAQLDAHSLVGQPNNTLAGRIGYQFGLHGPALTVDTACSSSLVALHLAIRALRSGEAEMALAGGVNLLLTPDTSIMLLQAGLLAPDGRCKVFDASANGYVRGEGCGMVVLKPLERARADGDRICAVVRGSAVNHDGRSSSFTAPNGAAQAGVIRDALADAALTPEAIDLIEAHGTGTALGDPIELDSLHDVFSNRDRPLFAGSVKSAIGHTEAAAGIAGLIKAVQCLQARTLPPQVHFMTRNPHARSDTPIRVADDVALPPGVLRAGISAFGASGTNAHVVLESIESNAEGLGDGPPRLLLSAATPAALDELRRAMINALANGLVFADACHTAFVGRARLEYWLTADDAQSLANAKIRTGVVPDLEAPRGRRITLPPTPFDRKPFWLRSESESSRDRRPTIKSPHRSARSGETVWHVRFDAEAAWLRDHVVDSDVIMPAAAFLDLALSAGLRTLRGVAFRRKLPVPTDGIEVQLVQTAGGDVALYAEDSDSWIEVASAQSADRSFTDHRSDGSTEIEDEQDVGRTFDQASFAAELAVRGFSFGDTYQVIKKLVRRNGNAWAELDIAPNTHLDPPLLDAAFQVLTALLPVSAPPWLPARIGLVSAGESAAGAVRACARLRSLDDRKAIGDAWFERNDGSVVLRLEGIELQPSIAKPGAWYYDLLWRPASDKPCKPQGRWHLIGPDAERVASSLGCSSFAASAESLPLALDGIIDLRPLAANEPGACITATAQLARRVASMAVPPQLILVSRGASSAPPVLPAPVPAAAVLMGLQPVIEAEYPALRCRWIDLDPDEQDIPSALSGPAGRYACRFGRLVTPELVKAAPPPAGLVRLIPGPERSFADIRLLPDTPQAPGAHEVQVEVHASGLNFKDVLTALGRIPDRDQRLGLECVGVVIAVGAEVAGFAPGDRVIGFESGTLASRVTMAASRVIRCPEWLDTDTAATIPVACLTAWHGLHDLGCIQPGMRVLVHAGAGGVGSMAIKIARLAGAHVFATSSVGKDAATRAAGAEATGDSRSVGFVKQARDWAGAHGFDIVLNALGPEIAEASAQLLNQSGLFLEIGNAPRPAGVFRYATYDLEQPIRADDGWYADRMQRVLTLLKDQRLLAPRRTVLPIAQAGEALQALGQGRTIGKLVLRWPVPVAVSRDGTYLVTGGTGAVGRGLARWLTSAGATKVILAARHPEAVDGYETQAVDVSDPKALDNLLASIPDLRGVIHAAGVVRDATLEQINTGDVAAVLAPKVQAASELSRLLERRRLDFFMLVSSTAGSLAAPGQAAYAGANAWLDRLAAARRAQGQSAVAIGSGPWAGGMFARLAPADKARLRQNGFQPMAPHRAAAAFMQVVVDGAVHRVVMDRTQHRQTVVADDSIRSSLLAIPPAERLRFLQEDVGRRLVAVLGFPADTLIDPNRALRDLGLDSLLSVSVRNELAAGFGLNLPATLLFDHPTLSALAGHLMTLLDVPEPQLTDLDTGELAALLERELEPPS
jgi:acyl transferase domain-containing protein/NADPH:quinone reductase-like Zn-dependent oxidoreductase/acyl carrier protein/SAM-dependent methyltransferase